MTVHPTAKIAGKPAPKGTRVRSKTECKLSDGSPYSLVLIRQGREGVVVESAPGKLGIRFNGSHTILFPTALELEVVG